MYLNHIHTSQQIPSVINNSQNVNFKISNYIDSYRDLMNSTERKRTPEI